MSSREYPVIEAVRAICIASHYIERAIEQIDRSYSAAPSESYRCCRLALVEIQREILRMVDVYPEVRGRFMDEILMVSGKNEAH